MNANLLSLARDALGSDFSKLAGQFLGESPGATQSALSSLLPAVLGGIAQKGATAEGAASLLSLVNNANLDTSSLGNIAGLFGSGGTGMNDLLKQGTSRLVPALFGDKSGALVSSLSSVSGIKSSSATNLIAMVVPIVLTFLKKFVGNNGLTATSLSSLLASQGPNLHGVLDSRITGALGYASPGAYLGGLGTQAVGAAKRAGATVASGASALASTAVDTTAMAATTTKSAFTRWLPWLIGAAVLVFLWNLLGTRSPTPTPASTPQISAAPTATRLAAVEPSLPAKVYFDVGASSVGADGNRTIAAVAEVIKRDNLKVSIIGYTDKTGDTASNEALAKDRAASVRDALKAAGVAEANTQMSPPLFVEVGAGASDAEARRVEISKQ